MILSSLVSSQLRPKLGCWLKQTRNIRPNIKVAKDKFQLQIDVRNFNKDEIRIKARPEYVIIEGKQEKKTKTGLIMRQFTRRFRLPSGCSPECMESNLSADGILTITARRKVCEENLPCETLIPISSGKPEMDDPADASFVPIQDVSPKPVSKGNDCGGMLSKPAEKKPNACDDKSKPPSGEKK